MAGAPASADTEKTGCGPFFKHSPSQKEGTTKEEMAEAAPPAPILNFASQGRVILVTVDSSPFSMAALDYAIDVLKPVPNVDHVTALYVKEEPDQLLRFSLPDAFNEVEVRLAKLAAAVEAAVEKHAHAKGMDVSFKQVRGDPRECVCNQAELFDATVLVMGSRGRGPLRRALLGSVSDYAVHNAPCPVLVVRKASDKQEDTKGAA